MQYMGVIGCKYNYFLFDINVKYEYVFIFYLT